MSAHPVAAWEAARKARSAQLVKAGLPPLERIGVSPVPRRTTRQDLKIVWADGKGLYISNDLNSRRPMGTDEILFDKTQTFVFVDQEALKRCTAVLRSKGEHQAARAIGYLARQEFSSVYVCLTRALAVRWWDPFSGRGSLAQWAGALGVEGSVLQIACNLYERLAKGRPAPEEIERKASRLASCALQTGVHAQYAAFDLARSLSELWEAVCKREPGLLERYLLNGDVVRYGRPQRLNGGLLIAPVSTPCRLRPGWVTIFNHSGLEVKAELEKFLAHDEAGKEGLYAQVRVSKGKNFEKILRSWESGEEWLLTVSLVRSRDTLARAMWLLDRKANRPASTQHSAIAREVPIDVALAGS